VGFEKKQQRFWCGGLWERPVQVGVLLEALNGPAVAECVSGM